MSQRLPAAADTAPPVADPIEIAEQELVLLTRLLEAAQRRRSYPLERAHYLVLSTLDEAGPQSVGGLAGRLALDDSTMTRQVAAMERSGLLEKVPNPADGRGTLIHATPAGDAAMRSMRAMRCDRVARLLRDWPAAERCQLARLLERFNASLLDYLGATDTR